MTCGYTPHTKSKAQVWIDDPTVHPDTSLVLRNPTSHATESTTMPAADAGIIRHLDGPAELTEVVTAGHSCKTTHLGFVAHTKDGVLVMCKANPSGTPADTWQVADTGTVPDGQLHATALPVFPLKVQEGHSCSAEHLGWTAYTKSGAQLTCRPNTLARTPAHTWQS